MSECNVKKVPFGQHNLFGSDDETAFEVVLGHVGYQEFNQAAEDDGNDSPELCAHSHLEHVYGCLVEIEDDKYCLLETDPAAGFEPVTVYYWV